jgi:hypothetical protein
MAHVDCESLASQDPFLHTARHHGLEQLAQKIALAKTAAAVLRECRVIGNPAIQSETTEME